MSAIVLPKGRTNRYHKRSPWACDECKLRKKKCDGTQPCRPCTLYEKECTYELRTKPSHPPTQRIRELEENIRSVRDLLGTLKSDLSGHRLTEVQRMLDMLKPAADASPQTVPSPGMETTATSEALKSMLVGRGRVLQSENKTFFHGPYSGPAVIYSVLEFFERTDTDAMHTHVIELFDLADTTSKIESVKVSHGPHLPERQEAIELFNIVMVQTHPFLQFLDPTLLWNVLESSYNALDSSYAESAAGDLALCHIVLALGFSLDLSKHHRHGCEWAVSPELEHYTRSRQLLDLTAIDDLTRLQAILCTIVFLISKSRLSSAYTYIGIAVTSAIKQGLHLISGTVTPPDQVHTATPTLTTLVNIDLYVSTVLGLPPLINIDTAGTTLEATKEPARFCPMKSQGSFGNQNTRHNLQAVSNDLSTRYSQIVSLAASVLWDLGALSTDSRNGVAAGVDVDIALLKNAERDLAIWSRGIGIALSPPASDFDDVPERVSVAERELELSIYWAQLLLYLPFLHYLRPLADGKPVPESMSRPALTSLKIAVNTISRCESLLLTLSYSEAYKHFMHPSNWTCIYTVFLAVVALIFLISIHEGTSKPSEAWRKAETGIKILVALRCHSGGANPCLGIIKDLVRQLNHTVDFDIEEIERTTPRVCQRWGGQDSQGTATHTSPQYEAASSLFSEPRDVQMNSENQHLRPSVAETGAMSSADAMLATAQHANHTPAGSDIEQVVSG